MIFLMFFSINLDESFVELGNINNTDSSWEMSDD